MNKKTIVSNKLPQVLGPYSHVVISNGFAFLSGQIPLDENGIVPQGIELQTQQVLDNIKMLLEDCSLTFSNIVKTTLFIKNMDDFVKINEIYGKYFCDNFPARSCIEVARLPKDVLIEIEIVAVIGDA